MQALPIVTDCGCGTSSGGGGVGPPGPPGPVGPAGPQGPPGAGNIIFIDPVDPPADINNYQFAVNVVCNTFWYWTPPPVGTWTSMPFQNLPSLPTIVELRQQVTVACDPPPMAFTQGNLVVGDEQPCPYRFDFDSLDDDDDISTILPNDRAETVAAQGGDRSLPADKTSATPGRWKQVIFA